MLKSFGVSGVKVQEVVSLDKEILNDLPYVLPSTSRLDMPYSNGMRQPACVRSHFSIQMDRRRPGQAGAKLP